MYIVSFWLFTPCFHQPATHSRWSSNTSSHYMLQKPSIHCTHRQRWESKIVKSTWRFAITSLTPPTGTNLVQAWDRLPAGARAHSRPYSIKRRKSRLVNVHLEVSSRCIARPWHGIFFSRVELISGLVHTTAVEVRSGKSHDFHDTIGFEKYLSQIVFRPHKNGKVTPI